MDHRASLERMTEGGSSFRQVWILGRHFHNNGNSEASHEEKPPTGLFLPNSSAPGRVDILETLYLATPRQLLEMQRHFDEIGNDKVIFFF